MKLLRKKDQVLRQSVSESREAGYTLLELLVVISILALLATLAAPQAIKYFSRSKIDVAQMQIRNVATALEIYFLDNGHYPSQDIGLKALIDKPANEPNWNGPYVKNAELLLDPWGKPYIYRKPGSNAEFEVMSYGRSGQPGGVGDDREIHG